MSPREKFASAIVLVMMLLWSVSAPCGVAVFTHQVVARATERKVVEMAAEDDDNWVMIPSSPHSGSNPDGPAQSVTRDSGGEQRDRALGASDAVITIEEFSDFECPYCRQADGVIRQVLAKYGRSVRLVYKDFPLPSHSYAMSAAIAARCAGDQDQFWQYHDALFSGRSGFAPSDLKALARSLGLDGRAFDACLDRSDHKSEVEADFEEGRGLGVSGTPTFIINGQKYGGMMPFAAFRTAIDAQLSAGESR